MNEAPTTRWWPLAVSAITLLLSVLGILADTTTIITNQDLKSFLSKLYPYAIVVATLAFASLSVFYWWRARRYSEELRRSLEGGERDRLTHETQLRERQSLEFALLRRLCRVVGSGTPVTSLPDIPESHIQSLFDELVGALPPDFESHHKFSVARPNADGTFSLIAARGMDPAAIASIEQRASWATGRSFYASLLNDANKAEWRIFPTSDTSYVDTRSAGNSVSRPTSSSSHFLLALRDEDLYVNLPKQTLALVSVGIPKRIGIPSAEDGEELFKSVLPVAKAIEVLLLAESRSEAARSKKKEEMHGE